MILAQRGIVLGRLAAKVDRSHVHAANGLRRCEELPLIRIRIRIRIKDDQAKDKYGHVS